MRSETVRLEWMGDRVFQLQDGGGYGLRMAQPDGVNAADLLPLSLIGCAAWDVLAILVKQRQKVESFDIQATSERDPDPPWRFRRIVVVYRITGRELSPEAARRAVDLTEQKYCSVFATLKDAVEIESKIELREISA